MSQGVNITIDIRGSDSQGNPQGVAQNPQGFVQNLPDSVNNPPPYSSVGQPQLQMGYPPPSGGYPNNMGWNQPPMGYPPPSGSYPNNMGWNPGPPPQQQQPQPPSQVIIATPIVVEPTKVEPLGPDSFLTICPKCQFQGATMVETETSMVQHFWALGLCIIGCWPCVLIPYCSNSCMNAKHYCSHCGELIGRHSLT